MSNILQDLRFAIRQLRKSSGFTLLATLTLAIGLGSATAVFSLVDAVLLRPLPFVQPDRIVALDTLSQPRGAHDSNAPATLPSDTSYPNFFDWRDQAKSFDSMASWQTNAFNLATGSGTARRIDSMRVSSDFFRVLGINPALGRSFTRADEQPGNRSILISHTLWQTAFNSSPQVIGRSLKLNDETFFVIGVLPSGFAFPNAETAEVWTTPARLFEGKNPSGKQRGWNQVSVIARLAPGVGIVTARAEMQRIQQGLARQYPDDNKPETAVSVTPELQDIVGDVQQPLHILFAAVSFLLLIACANVAGLLITRIVGRRPELAVRSALGASRLQIVRQLLLESLLLSCLGGALGLFLAYLALKAAPRLLPPDLPRAATLAFNAHVFFFALAASLVTGFVFGVLPAWRMLKLDPALALRDNSRGTSASKGQQGLHAALVIGETAMGLILLVGAGLLIRSFNKILLVNPGFNPQHVLTFELGIPHNRMQDQQLIQFVQQTQSRLAAIPGVTEATYGNMPLTDWGGSITFTIPGHPTAPGDEPSANFNLVGANLFHTLQIPLRRGRSFDASTDRFGSAPVIIINKAFADRYFPGEDALGKHVTSDLSNTDVPESREVVGIIDNIASNTLTEQPDPAYYIPFGQLPLTTPTFAIRVSGDPNTYINSARTVIAQQDPTIPIYKVRSYDSLLARSTAQQRFQTLLLTAFAAIALLLAAVGLYGVLSYMVKQRTQEFGLRMALGAQRSDALTLVLRRGLMLASIGLMLGLAASVLLTRYIATLLFNTTPLDLTTFASTTALLLAVSIFACLVPAFRASRLEPNETLRQQ